MRMIVCIVQARMGSKRLPGKVAMKIGGKPMLAHELERLSKSKKIDALICATTVNPDDDGIVEIAKSAGVAHFRGDEADVLDRYYHAGKDAKADVVVRVTGDCPLHDPEVVDEVVEHFI